MEAELPRQLWVMLHSIAFNALKSLSSSRRRSRPRKRMLHNGVFSEIDNGWLMEPLYFLRSNGTYVPDERNLSSDGARHSVRKRLLAGRGGGRRLRSEETIEWPRADWKHCVKFSSKYWHLKRCAENEPLVLNYHSELATGTGLDDTTCYIHLAEGNCETSKAGF